MKLCLGLLSAALVASGAAGAAGAEVTPEVARRIQRSVRGAGLVVLAKPAKFMRPSARVRFRVVEALKGEDAAAGKVIEVNLRKAPVGLWPKMGTTAILCLVRSGSGRPFELATHHGSVLAPDEEDAVRKVVSLELPTVIASAGGPVLDEDAARVLEKQVALSDTILIGQVSDVREGDASGYLAAFKVEEALLGYGGYDAPITVLFGGEAPEAGRYLLFLRGGRADGHFVVASAQWGVVRIEDAATESTLKGTIREAAAGRTAVLTTIHATVAEWQSAWNARDIERCIKCYSRENSLRKHYKRSVEGRERLIGQLESFPARVELSMQQISPTRAAGAAKGADVTGLLRLSTQTTQDRRLATMKFVFEQGEWLILDEGF